MTNESLESSKNYITKILNIDAKAIRTFNMEATIQYDQIQTHF